MAYKTEEWKVMMKNYLFEMNAKINAAKNAQEPNVVLERIRKENIKFVNRMLPDLMPTLKE